MEWKDELERKGMGFLATSGKGGEVDIAVFSRPRLRPDGTVAWGMAHRLTHANLGENPRAAFAWVTPGFGGVRLFLEKVGEETEGPALEEVRRSAAGVVGPGAAEAVRSVVTFRVTKALPLVTG